MPGITFYNLRLLGHIEDTDFTDYQGIGSDPLYRRYESVFGVVKKFIEPKYHSFLSRPFYENGFIYWYVEEWADSPVRLTECSAEERSKYLKIKEETVQVYRSALLKAKSEDFIILNGVLKYIDDEFIYCYDGKIVLIAWGMRPDESKHIVKGSWFKPAARIEKKKITFEVGSLGELDTSNTETPYYKVVNRSKGEKLTSIDIPLVKAKEGYSFTGWSPDPLGFVVTEDFVFNAQYIKLEINVPPVVTEQPPIETYFKVSFDAGIYGSLSRNTPLEVRKGHVLSHSEIPDVLPNKGYNFLRWVPSVDMPILNDTVFVAEYKQETVRCVFSAGTHGTLTGNSELFKFVGETPLQSEIPAIKPHKGFKFIGWDISPFVELKGDRLCTAQYEEILPWYRRFWRGLVTFLTGSGCLKWLLWFLLFLLVIWLLSFLLKGCHESRDIHGYPIIDDSEVIVNDTVTCSDGSIRDDNGDISGIVGDDGSLPDHGFVSPIVGDDGSKPPVISNPGTPDVIANRLNIYFEDENADLKKWSKDFKKVYPDEEFQIIGYDPNVRLIQIQVPENLRNTVREELPKKIPDQEFFVIDESIINLRNYKGQESTYKKGWHLKATHVWEAWGLSKGNPNLVVAIVDDGIDVNHPMFKGRFYKAYNVFKQNRALSLGEGHGTHVAGLAVGSADYYKSGAAGVAPNCKIMPIQVFDNGMCTFSSLASGIMYAIHNGASVVNISIGPSFKGLDQLPIEEQVKVAQQFYKNEEKVYKHIFKVANEKNVILVFAAGNDNIVTAILPECRSINSTVNVAACTPDFKSSSFTNFHLGTNVSAPGVGIYSAFPKSSFEFLDGTSMAAPIITGAIALMRSIKPDLTAKQAIAVIQHSGQELDHLIPPMILIDRALLAVKKGDIPSEPVWMQRIENGTIENVKEKLSKSAIKRSGYNLRGSRKLNKI